MSINIVRAAGNWFVQAGDRAVPVETAASTTGALLGDRVAIKAAATLAATHPQAGALVSELELESPVTTPCRLVAQMVNYKSHAKDSGIDPGKVQPTFFRKASGSISGPYGEIVKPAHVRLLDYEIELGLVMGAELPVGTVVGEHDLPDYVAGLVLANDVSARDIQLAKGQFYESKSYPTFTPVGPRLVLLERQEFEGLVNLRLQLSVNGVLRQDRTVADMIAFPSTALTALARFQTLRPGDLLLTGTPGGTALKAPPRVVEKIAALLPPAVKWKIFFNKQASNPAYLTAGDVVTATIRTADGSIDLGSQRIVVAGR